MPTNCGTPVSGIELIVVGGHTPGQLIVVVHGQDGTAILASDAVHTYDERRLDRPFSVVSDVAGMYRNYDTITLLSSRANTFFIPGHDPAVLDRFSPHIPISGGAAVRVL